MHFGFWIDGQGPERPQWAVVQGIWSGLTCKLSPFFPQKKSAYILSTYFKYGIGRSPQKSNTYLKIFIPNILNYEILSSLSAIMVLDAAHKNLNLS